MFSLLNKTTFHASQQNSRLAGRPRELRVSDLPLKLPTYDFQMQVLAMSGVRSQVARPQAFDPMRENLIPGTLVRGLKIVCDVFF